MVNRNQHFKVQGIAFTLVLFISVSASAQRRGIQTVVMNDGTWVTGTIVNDSGDYISLKVMRPRIITLKKSDIFLWNPDLLARDSKSGDAWLNGNNNEGYTIRFSASVLAGRNEYGRTGTMSFHFSNGYQFSNGFALGVGAGIEEFDAVIMPVYCDLRYHPLKTRVSPFAWLKTGIGIPLGDSGGQSSYSYGYYPDARAGVMFNAGTGIALYTGSYNGVNVGIGYRFQKLTFKQENYWGQITENEIITNFNRFEVQFGIIFR